jgi:lactate dehydrogenase-like 2-hydroxyacid dehydrogenase
MQPCLIQIGRLAPQLEAALASEFEIYPLWKENDAPAFIAAHARRINGIVTSARAGADRALIEALPSLKLIANFGVGYDTVDVAAARERGVVVSNTPDVLNDCVADTAFALILDVTRSISAADRFVRRGEWKRGASFPLAVRVTGKNLGIVGLGRIGQAIARRSAGFGMPVRYHTRRPMAGMPWAHEPSLQELARWADILVVACAGGQGTRHLVSKEVLDALGPKGYIVNISRGTVIDEAAMVEALAARRIAGAGIDVFENEPHVPDALLELDNVVLLPHIGSGTHETRAAMGELVLANIRSFYSDGRLLTPVQY